MLSDWSSVAKWWENKRVKIRRVDPQLTFAWRRVPEDDAMETDSGSGWQGRGALEYLLRERIRATIETIVDEELAAALGAVQSQRVGAMRTGYRHGKRARGKRAQTLTWTCPGCVDTRKARALVIPSWEPALAHSSRS